MQILYRISNNSYNKERLPYASKEYCLSNFIDTVVTKEDQMLIIADGVNNDLLEAISSYVCDNIKIVKKNLGSNGASFRFQLEYAASLSENEIVLLQEDDYLYKNAGWPLNLDTCYSELIDEALSQADYVSFYDHPDKYVAPALGGNKFISPKGIENTGIFCTRHSHWKFTNSTTCTFACRARTIKEDIDTWKQFCPADHPYDFHAFIALGLRGRTLATPIPGKSTHTDTAYLSPFFASTKEYTDNKL
jgi:hypothetical protein